MVSLRLSHWTKAAFPILIASIAACSGGAALSPSSNPKTSSSAAPSSSVSAAPLSSASAAPLASASAQAPVPPNPPDAIAAAPSNEEKCRPEAPKPDAAFLPITLRIKEPASKEDVGEVEPEVAQRFPAMSENGQTIAIIDTRSTWEENTSVHLVLLDVKTNKLTPFILWTQSERPLRRKEAQAALDKTRWQTLIRGEREGIDCPRGAPLERRAVRFDSAEFQFTGDGFKAEVLRRVGSVEKKLPLAMRTLPGRMGEAAVPTRDVGGACGAWAFLSDGWVTQDKKVYLFELGAFLGGRCSTPVLPVEYCALKSTP